MEIQKHHSTLDAAESCVDRTLFVSSWTTSGIDWVTIQISDIHKAVCEGRLMENSQNISDRNGFLLINNF